MPNILEEGPYVRTTAVLDPRTEGLKAGVGAVFRTVGGASALVLYKTDPDNDFAWADYAGVPVAATNGARGGLIVFTFDLADAASADYDKVVDCAFEVIDAFAQKRANAGGAVNTVQVKKAGNAITDAMSINIADTTLARAATINDANATFAKGDTLRVSVVKAGGNAAALVSIVAIPR